MRALFLAVLLVGCDLATEPDIPEGAVPMDPAPAVYDQWWNHVKVAAKISRSVEHVRWFAVPEGLFWSERDGVWSAGRWIPDGRIYLAGGWVMDELTVKHEMLHELLQGDYEHAHPLFAHYSSCKDSGGFPTPC